MNTESKKQLPDYDDAGINQQQGYTVPQFRHVLAHDWQLSPLAISLLRKHFLRKWKTSNLLGLLKDGCINFEGVNYQVIWVGGKVQATSCLQVALSFRHPYDTIFPTVLVKMTTASPTWEELEVS